MDFVKPIAVLLLSYLLIIHSKPLSGKSSERSLRGGRSPCGQSTIIETRATHPLPLLRYPEVIGTGILPASFDYSINPPIAFSLLTPSSLPSSIGGRKTFLQNPYTFGYPISTALPIPITSPFASLALEYPPKSPPNVTYDGKLVPNKILPTSIASNPCIESPKFNYTFNYFIVPSLEDSPKMVFTAPNSFMPPAFIATSPQLSRDIFKQPWFIL